MVENFSKMLNKQSLVLFCILWQRSLLARFTALAVRLVLLRKPCQNSGLGPPLHPRPPIQSHAVHEALLPPTLAWQRLGAVSCLEGPSMAALLEPPCDLMVSWFTFEGISLTSIGPPSQFQKRAFKSSSTFQIVRRCQGYSPSIPADPHPGTALRARSGPSIRLKADPAAQTLRKLGWPCIK